MTTKKITTKFKNLKFSSPLFIAVGGAILLGASPIFVRLTDLGPISTAFYRVFFALPFLWIWMRRDEQKKPKNHQIPVKNEYLLFALAGLFFALDLMSWHWALDLTTIVNATLFNNFTPFFVPLLIWMFYAKRPSLTFVGAILIALTGSTILTGESIQLNIIHVWGDLFALFSAVGYAAYILVLKQLRHRLGTPVIMFWTTFFNMWILLACTLGSSESLIPSTLNDWIGILGLAILVHVAGQGLLAYAMGHLSAAFISVVLLISPVVAALLGWVIFKEAVGLLELIGALLILVSIVIARQDERKGN
ncbi:MAG: DMT family transporter [Alphaproteobacteria bacterium]|nr:DMT family transporter [Alphaproteobacteria bacterium]